jgi:hypothetical protein
MVCFTDIFLNRLQKLLLKGEVLKKICSRLIFLIKSLKIFHFESIGFKIPAV